MFQINLLIFQYPYDLKKNQKQDYMFHTQKLFRWLDWKFYSYSWIFSNILFSNVRKYWQKFTCIPKNYQIDDMNEFIYVAIFVFQFENNFLLF